MKEGIELALLPREAYVIDVAYQEYTRTRHLYKPVQADRHHGIPQPIEHYRARGLLLHEPPPPPHLNEYQWAGMDIPVIGIGRGSSPTATGLVYR